MSIPDNVAFQTYVILRCARWGQYVRWAERDKDRDPRPPRIGSWWGPIVLDGNVEQIGEGTADICPVDVAEGMETQQCVYALPEHLRDTIIEEYVVCGNQAQKADALGIDQRQYRRRLSESHTLLLGLFNDVAAGIEPHIAPRTRGRPPTV